MNELYVFTIYPIELFYKYIYLVLVSFTENYGLALFALSLLNYFLLMPLNKLVRGLQESESSIQQILAPQLQRIRETSRDAARHQRIQNLYQRYSYHPIFAIRNVFPLLVQLPFLMAVYFMLSSLTNLEEVSFLFLQNLSKPDALFFGLNVMPLVMTLVSLVNACFVVKLSKPQRKQAIVVALLFFVLLYSAPSALLLYWTMNNVLIIVFSLVSKISFVERVCMSLSKLRQQLLPKLIDSSGLSFGLCFVAPLFFTLSLNVHYFNEAQITNFALFAIVCFILCLLAGIILDWLITQCARFNLSLKIPYQLCMKKQGSRFTLEFSTILYLFAALVSAYFISTLCINLRLYLTSEIAVMLLRGCLFLLLFFIIKKYSFKMLNYCILSLMLYSSIQFAQTQHSDNEAGLAAKQLLKQASDSFPWEETLDTKPNIYLFYLESYMNSKTLRDTYQFDNSAFENRLQDQGFQIYEDIYSHASFTKGSLLSLFIMSDDVSTIFLGNADVSTHAHDILSGSRDNLLFKFLNQNNYAISCFYDIPNYYIRHKHELLDYTSEEVDSSIHSVLSEIAPSLGIKVSRLMNKVYHEKRFRYSTDYYKKVADHIAYVQKINKPSFFFIKPPNDLHFNRESEHVKGSYKQWIASGTYQSGVEKMNKELIDLIDDIEKHDPNALIILLGDHGHKFAGAAGGIPILRETPRGIKANFPHFKMSSEEFVEDMYSVYLAVKMPHNSHAKLELDAQFAYADLFKYTFMALDNNPKYIENKSSNVSMNYSGLILKRNATVFEDGE